MMKIYCPICEYEPVSQDRWMCVCLHSWNTFDTMGRCPECKRLWKDTQCPQCEQWSPHHKWYHYDPDEEDETIEEYVPEYETV